MAGGERGRLVEEEKLGVELAPHVALTALEGAHADQPVLGLPAAAAQRSIVAMDPPAAIAHEPAALGDGVKLAERIDAILQRRAGLRHSGGRLRFSGLRPVRGREALTLSKGGERGARTAAELRILRSGPAAGFTRRADLLVRVHVLRRLRRGAASERLSQLRRRLRASADQARAGMASRIVAGQAAGVDEAARTVVQPRRDRALRSRSRGRSAQQALNEDSGRFRLSHRRALGACLRFADRID